MDSKISIHFQWLDGQSFQDRMDSLLQLDMYPDHNTEVEDGQQDEQTLSTIGWQSFQDEMDSLLQLEIYIQPLFLMYKMDSFIRKHLMVGSRKDGKSNIVGLKWAWAQLELKIDGQSILTCKLYIQTVILK